MNTRHANAGRALTTTTASLRMNNAPQRYPLSAQRGHRPAFTQCRLLPETDIGFRKHYEGC
jgi:hypothetical protein